VSLDDAVEVVGGGLAGLREAADLARGGGHVVYREPGLRAGGRFVTESFLTPFRFNLGPALVPRDLVAGAHVIEPDPLLSVGSAKLGRASHRLVAGSTVAQTLDASGIVESGTRASLTALALLLGIDPAEPGSGTGLVSEAARLQDLILVAGGNGSVPAALIDEIVARGGRVFEGTAQWSPEPTLPGQLGMCRLFFGVRGAGPVLDAFAQAHGFSDEASLVQGLSDLRAGRVGAPFGFLLSNRHLDSAHTTGATSSFVWQGPLPLEEGAISRPDYARRVLEAVGVAEADVIFQLLWLPAETRESLGPAPSYSDC
jgi:hypothetical protein